MRTVWNRAGLAIGLVGAVASVATIDTSARQTAAPPAATEQVGRGNQPGPDMNQYYQPGLDATERPGVPKGALKGPFVLPDSRAYPGTQHTYWIHVPAQYDPSVPAHLMIFQDGHAMIDPTYPMRAPNVLDNLIYRREVPVMITVFINPGRRPDQPEPATGDWGDRSTNRPTEYNSLDGKYASVICDELLPVLNKDYNISKDPEHRGLAGVSSGAIAAFTVAWQRPDQFRKVLSIVGSFVNIRGGDAYADIVAKSEKKPLRIFINDGRNDNRGGRGDNYDPRRDWYYQNIQLVKALTARGYDLNYSFGLNTHGGRMGGPMLPEMLRWLWRDHDMNTDPVDAVGRGFNEPKTR